MGDLDDSFTQLLGHQPTDTEKQNLYRARDTLNLKPTDAVWRLLMVLEHYETLLRADSSTHRGSHSGGDQGRPSNRGSGGQGGA